MQQAYASKGLELMNNHWESKSEKRENFAFMCLFSIFLGWLAYGGVLGLSWLRSWRELVATGVGLTVAVLVCRGVCGFLEDYDKHKRRQAEEKERWARRSQADAKEQGTKE